MRFCSGVRLKLSAIILAFFVSCICQAGECSADEDIIRREMNELKARIAQLEEKLAKQEEKTKGIEKINESLEGFSIGAGATMVVQATHNANSASAREEDVADGSYSVDLEIEKEFQEADGRALIHLETGQGQGAEDELAVFGNVNQDANNDEDVKVAEAYYEQNLFNKRMSLTFGKLDPTVYLDTNAYANDETAQFLGRVFRNSAAIEFPDNAAGLRLGLAPLEILDVEAGVWDADSDFEDVFDSVFLGSQINLKPKFSRRQGNYRLIGWVHDGNHAEWQDATNDKKKSYGFGISFDQELTDSIGAFLRYGWQNPEVYPAGSAFSLECAWSTGLHIKGGTWGRENDTLGLAVGYAIPSGDYKKADPARNARKEGHLECYYNYKVNEHLSLSPDLQVVWNPYGDDFADNKDTITVAGLRAQVDF